MPDHYDTLETRDAAARERAQFGELPAFIARALAARHSEWGEPFDDLLQVAWIGFLKALDRFDPAREVFVAQGYHAAAGTGRSAGGHNPYPFDAGMNKRGE